MGRVLPFSIHPFGVTLALGFALGLLLTTGEARRRGLREGEVVDVALWVMLAALVGGRFLYVLANWDYYKDVPGEILLLTAGGLSYHGGLAVGGAVAWVLATARGWYFPDLADAAAPGLALGYTIARLGCNVIGKPTYWPWGLSLNGILVHPQGLYASIANYLLFIILWKWRPRAAFRGELFSLYLILYGGSRFAIEFTRYGKLLGPLSLAQWGSLLLMGFGFYLRRIWGGDLSPSPPVYGQRPFNGKEAAQWSIGLAFIIFSYILIK
ncbi:MAG: prolipoprotein diacylglyceryl transferase [Limnochordia bacterium]|jgi:phosphatidylglycerol:prolipoprotein diacylglycerol transferase